jgi:protein gp37
MGDNSGIEWTDATWNPTRGCSRISPGCQNCYAELQAARMAGPGGAYEGLLDHTKAGRPRWNGQVRLVESQLGLPIRWTKPRRIFVDSMSDLFHEGLPVESIARVFAVMAQAKQHTFQVLTKRAPRMAQLLDDEKFWHLVWSAADVVHTRAPKHIWLGVSVEDQQRADERIPWLLKTTAAVRFVSAEPLLGPVSLVRAVGEPTEDAWDEVNSVDDDRPEQFVPEDELEADSINFGPDLVPNPAYGEWQEWRRRRAQELTFRAGIDWVIAGAESGPGARRMEEAWVRTLRDECAVDGVKFFFKQSLDGGGKKVSLPVLDGKQHAEFPA